MTGLIGTDEAGYGPNLGPLTVCGTAWQTPDQKLDLYDLLADCVSNGPSRSNTNKIAICDSKKIYSPSGSIALLEKSVLSALAAVSGEFPTDSRQLGKLLNIDFLANGQLPELESSTATQVIAKIALPIAANRDQITELAANFISTCDNAGVELRRVICRAVFPKNFNELVGKFGNKAELLSATTCGIVKQLVADRKQSYQIVCDKHGGRNKYAGVLNQYLTDQFITVGRESREASEYQWQQDGESYDIVFRSKGESFLPTALASMFAKYVREVAMEIMNNFWVTQVPSLRPTKGYPVDAGRFKKEIAAAQKKLGIEDNTIWRCR